MAIPISSPIVPSATSAHGAAASRVNQCRRLAARMAACPAGAGCGCRKAGGRASDSPFGTGARLTPSLRGVLEEFSAPEMNPQILTLHHLHQWVEASCTRRWNLGSVSKPFHSSVSRMRLARGLRSAIVRRRSAMAASRSPTEKEASAR